MSILIIQTEDDSAAAEIFAFEKTLSMDDWIQPGRLATDGELEDMANLLNNQTEFKDYEAVFAELIASLKK